MRFREPDPPIRSHPDGFVVNLTDDERTMVCRLVGELRELISDPEPNSETLALINRLFPAAYPDDPTAEAEYQRLMREELVESRRAAFDTVDRLLSVDANDDPISEADLVALMQSINAVRLVLGSMLQVTDDPDGPEVMPGFEGSREYHLYGYLSWLLDWAVGAMSGDT